MRERVLVTPLSNKLGTVNLSPLLLLPMLEKKEIKKTCWKFCSLIEIFHRIETKTCHFELAAEAHSSFKDGTVANSIEGSYLISKHLICNTESVCCYTK